MCVRRVIRIKYSMNKVKRKNGRERIVWDEDW